MKNFFSAFFIPIVIALALPASSQTLAVGSCKPLLKSYTTIQAAVSAATPGSTIDVCPGTYAEQVVITTPLTLRGISAPPLSAPTIVPPAGGLTAGAIQPSTSVDPVASLIAVDTNGAAGAVSIQGIALNGQNACPSTRFVSGILYVSTSGAISDTAIQNLGANQCDGSAIWVENDSPQPMFMTAKNNFIQSFIRGYGIGAFTGPSASTLAFLAQDNLIAQVLYGAVLATNSNGVDATSNIIDGVGYGIYVLDASTVTNNTITAPAGSLAIYVDGDGARVTNNTIDENGMAGIYIAASSKVTVTSNKIIGNLDELSMAPPGGPGIISLSPSVTIQSNSLAHLATGIELECNAATVSANTIFDTTLGVSDAAPGVTIAGNFVAVTTPQTNCP
jgi:parallel beta-helix repeat protein